VVGFRKSKSFGPFRVTASKSGFSVSGGVPGFRASRNSRGQTRRTVRIPGTGIYDTKVVGGASGTRRSRQTSSAVTLGPEMHVTAVDATGGSHNLRDGDSGVVSAQIVGVKDHSYVAATAGLVPRADGWVGGLRQGLLVEQGDEYRALVLIGPDDNPALFRLKKKGADLTPRAVDVGRLNKRDRDKWAPSFAGRSIGVVLFVAATPGMPGKAEVRFRPDQLDDDADMTAATASAAPTAREGWYADPQGISSRRWWDGAAWTDHTSEV
jgi:hypothetical protein